MIETAEPREQRLRCVAVCKIQHVTFCAGRQCGEGLVYSRLPTGGDHHSCPLAGRRLCGGQADA
jgi:hypothetical protein